MLAATSDTGGTHAVPSGQLFERWRHSKDRQARDELIQRFLPLARKLARRYAQSSEPYEDLVQVASLGLVKAVEDFLLADLEILSQLVHRRHPACA